MRRVTERPACGTTSADVGIATTVALVEVALAAWRGGFGATVGGEDLFGMYLGKHRFIADALAHGRLPLWNADEFCGFPLHGSAQGSVFYLPIPLANLVLAPWTAMQVLYALHLWLMAFALTRYCRSAGLGTAGATVAAVLGTATVFNGVAGVAVDHPHTLFETALLPPILLGWEATLRGRPWAAGATALLLGVQWWTGYPEPMLDTAVLLGVMAALSPGPPLVRRAAAAVAVVGLGAAIGALQILPLAETLAESTRIADMRVFTMSRGLFAVTGPGALASASVERYGAAAVFLVLLGLATPGRRRAAWALALAWSLFAAHLPFRLLYLVWPFAGVRFLWGWSLLAPVFVGCLAALGLDGLARATPPARRRPLGLATALAALALASGAWTPAAVFAACALAAAAAPRFERAWLVPAALAAAHGVVVLLELGTLGTFKAAPDLRALTPRVDALRPLVAAGDARLVTRPELQTGLVLSEHLPSPWGYEPAVPPRRVTRLGQLVGLDDLMSPFVDRTWQKLGERPQVAALLGVGYVALPAARAPALLQAGYRQVLQLPDGDVVVFRPPVPRVQLVHEVRRVADEEAAFAAIADRAFDPRAAVVVEADAPTVAAALAGAPEPVTASTPAPERFQIDATATAPGLLVVGQNWFPGWEATVDGAPMPVLRVDYTFQGIALGAGRHAVTLAYRPRSFRLGVAVSAVALALAAAWIVTGRPRLV